jgi:hypothetical protein
MISALANSKHKIPEGGAMKFARHKNLATHAGYQHNSDIVEGVTLSLMPTDEDILVSVCFILLCYLFRQNQLTFFLLIRVSWLLL